MASIAVFLDASQFGPDGIVVWLYTRLNAENPELAVTSMLELLAVLPQVCPPLAPASGARHWRPPLARPPAPPAHTQSCRAHMAPCLALL